MIGQERQIIIIIGSMYIPVSWLNYLCNNFFSIFLAQYFCTFLHSWLVLYFFYSILYLCLLTLSILGLFFLSTIIGRSVWYLVFGTHNYLRPSDCPCLFCEVFLCISLHRNLPGSLVSLWKTLVYQGVMCLCCSNCLFCEWLSEIFSRCLVSLFFKISVFNRV